MAAHTAGTGQAATTDWDRVFFPRSVAVVGATGRASSPMARPLQWLAERGFDGAVWPVNPKYDELAGLPCLPSLSALPGPVDLVLVMAPAAAAVDAVREAGRAGAAAVIVFASGFAEVGDDGAALQRELVAAAREAGTRVLGPNCQGILNPSTGLFATFTAAAERPLTGTSGIAYVGQSGAIGGSVLDIAAEQGIDLAAWVSTGNQADVDLTEIGRHLVRRPGIDVLAVYLESVHDGGAYEALAAEAAAAGTALVVLRSGRSDAGRRAAVSHTGAMLGDDTAFRLVSRRHGVVLVDDVTELLAAATALRGQARPTGHRVGLVTTSGGAGILAADRCSAHGLAVPVLSAPTREALAPLVPAFGALDNPVDVTAQLFNRDDRAFGTVCSIIAGDPGVDALLILITMVVGDAATALATDIAETDLGVPVSVVWLAGPDRTTEARTVLHRSGIPVYSSIAVATRVLDALAPPDRAGPDVDDPGRAPDDDGRPATNGRAPAGSTPASAERVGPDGWAVLREIGVRVPASARVTTPEDAARAASSLPGDGCVLKAVAPGLEHKTEVGGVRLGVPADAVAAVTAELLATVPGCTGVLVQEAVRPGLELLVGATTGRDGWPPVVTVGLGGTATEVHRDLATALAPVDDAGARRMLRELRIWPLLAGHRGAAPRDVDAVVDVLVRVGAAITEWSSGGTSIGAEWSSGGTNIDAECGDLSELEINPLIVGPAGDGVVAVDVLAR